MTLVNNQKWTKVFKIFRIYDFDPIAPEICLKTLGSVAKNPLFCNDLLFFLVPKGPTIRLSGLLNVFRPVKPSLFSRKELRGYRAPCYMSP